MSKSKYLIVRILAFLMISHTACAEIYRYQDGNGKWQYTDKAPPEKIKSEVVKIRGGEQPETTEEAVGENLADYLTKKINPNSDIEKASLAVVKIETLYGTGSGFFISENGYLITNKHVVRPSSSAQIENDLKQAEDNLKQSTMYLEDKGRELDRYKKEIDDFKIRVDQASVADKPKMQQEYNYHDNRYSDIKKQYQEAKKQSDAAKDQLEARKSAMSESTVASSFKIIFKDGTEKKARLVALGKDQDLALLQITGGYITPFLEEGHRETVSQGSEVFAIGSPLGFKDYVTKGIVTRQETDRIVTDTEILPGNSGGPLITPQGKVIGVNTQVLRANGAIGSEVFGFAIPIESVKKEFGAHWQEN